MNNEQGEEAANDATCEKRAGSFNSVGNEQGEEAANDATCEKRAGEISIAWVMSKGSICDCG